MTTLRPRMIETLAKIQGRLPTLNLQTFAVVPGSNSTVFRITASNAVVAKPLTYRDYEEMVVAAFDTKLALLSPSLERVARINHDSVDVVTGLVLANTPSHPVTDEDLGDKFRVVANNVFMDGDDGLWRLVGEGDGRRLVQAVKEDLTAMLNARITRKGGANMVIASSRINYVGLLPERGDYTMYWSLADDNLRYGFAALAGDQLLVANRHSDKIEKIHPTQVIDCAPPSNIPAELVKAADLPTALSHRPAPSDFTSAQATDFLGYWKKLYGSHPEFFSRLEGLISARRSVGNVDQPLLTIR